MKIVLYHTDDPLYSRYAGILEYSLKRQNINYHKKIIPRESWYKIVNIKPTFLLECRQKYKGSILYIDADAYLHKDCTEYMNSLDCDIAFCRVMDYTTGSQDNLTGTILINDTEKAREFLARWKEKSDKDSSRWDQATFTEAMEETENLRTHRLNPKYCFIFDNKSCLLACDDPVIEHFQASRLSDKNRKWYHKLLNKKSKRARRTVARTKDVLKQMEG